MYCIRVNKIRNVIAYISAGAVMVATITLMVQWIAGGCESIELYYHVETLDRIILVFELLCMVIITYLCFKYKKYIISVLTIFPTLLVAWLELFGPQRATIYHIYIDHLAILMCLIVGIIGSLIITTIITRSLRTAEIISSCCCSSFWARCSVSSCRRVPCGWMRSGR